MGVSITFFQKKMSLYFLLLREFSTDFADFFILFRKPFSKKRNIIVRNMILTHKKPYLALNEKTKQKSEKISDANFFINAPLKRIKKELQKSVENSRRSRKNKSDTFWVIFEGFSAIKPLNLFFFTFFFQT